MTLHPPDRLARSATLARCFAAATLCLAATSSAEAQVPCDTLPAPIVYGRGGSAPNQLVGRLAADLAASSAPLTIVYKDEGACFAMASLANGEKATGTARYWTKKEDGTVVRNDCTLPEAGVDPTWGSMAQLATTCAGIDALPADVSDEVGPISGFGLFVPTASTQQVISAEAVYYIYGLGVDDPAFQVAPWTVADAIASRTTTSAAGLLLAKAVGIDLSYALLHENTRSNQGSIDFVTVQSAAAIANPDAALGFASSETLDTNRDKVRSLAFQAIGQDFGYWADSTTTSFDKKNLREGRYFLWNPHHFYAKLDGPAGEVVDADTARWVGSIVGTEPLPDDLSWLDIVIEVGTIPECAMQVTRDGDVGPLASYQPDAPCGCYFEAKATGAAPASCQACAGDGPDDSCPDTAPVCRHGFCEVK